MAEVSPSGIITMEWRDLVIVTWSVDPALVAPLVPRGTVLDTWDGRALLSIVGLRFLNLRIAGLPVPLHQDFEQVNLRFYVRRDIGGHARPGVVFIKQIVPSISMTLAARLLYHENVVVATMKHDVQPAENGWAQYEWLIDGVWNRLSALRSGPAVLPADDSIEAFIKERPWGYTRQPDGSTVEYHVEHPAWEVWQADEATVACDVARVYGPEYVDVFLSTPASSFVAVGSEAVLHPGHALR